MPPPVATAEATAQADKNGPGAGSQGDGGAREGGPPDAAIDAPRDAPVDAPQDGPPDAPADAPADAAPADAGNDAGAIARSAGDPRSLLGAAGSLQADKVYVTLLINADEIKKSPVGAKLGPLLRGIPQWDEFMSGTELDPVRDTDWVFISGPSLINTTRDVVLIHYSAPDALVDKAVDVVSKKYDRGGPIDAGVAGVRASLAHADKAERVLLRPQPGVLAVVPTNVTEKIARQLAPPNRVHAKIVAGEAFAMRLVDPHKPLPDVPESILELRMRVDTRADGGAEIFLEGDTKDAAAAAQAADDLRKLIGRFSGNLLVGLMTAGILDDVDVSVDGKVVKVHRTATRRQLEAIASLVASKLGLDPNATAAQPGAAPSSPPPSAKP